VPVQSEAVLLDCSSARKERSGRSKLSISEILTKTLPTVRVRVNVSNRYLQRGTDEKKRKKRDRGQSRNH